MTGFERYVSAKGLKPDSLTTDQQTMLMQSYLSDIAAKAEKVGELEQKIADLEGDRAAAAQKAKKDMDDLMAKMVDIAKGANQFVGTKSFRAQLFEELSTKAVELKNAMARNSGTLEFKATFVRGSVVDNPLGQFLSGVGQLAHRSLTVYDALRKVPMTGNADNGRVRYLDWDQTNTVRNAGMVAEEGSIPEATARFRFYEESLKKVGNLIPFSDESEADMQFLLNEIERFLEGNLMLTINQQLVTGDGTGNNLTGMANIIPTYTAASEGVTDPNIFDLLVSIQTAIAIAAGNKGMADVVFMHPTDIDKLRRTKDANGQYIIPPFAGGPLNVSGMTIVGSADVVQNTLYVGTSQYAEIYEKDGFGIEFGYTGNDFRDGLKRMRIYKRLLFLIRQVDRSSFRRVTNIDVAVAALAPVAP